QYVMLAQQVAGVDREGGERLRIREETVLQAALFSGSGGPMSSPAPRQRRGCAFRNRRFHRYLRKKSPKTKEARSFGERASCGGLSAYVPIRTRSPCFRAWYGPRCGNPWHKPGAWHRGC